MKKMKRIPWLGLPLALMVILSTACVPDKNAEVLSLKATVAAQATRLAELGTPTTLEFVSPTLTPSQQEPTARAPLRPIWSVRCGGDKPLVVGDVVVAKTTEDYLMGLARVTGEKLWEWEVKGTAFAGDQERVYVYAHTSLYALDLHTGERVWKIEGPIARPHNLVGDNLPAYGILHLYDGMLYFARSRGETWDFVAVDASSGYEKWAYRFPSVGSIFITPFPEGLQVSSSGSDIVGLDPQTGELLWGPGESKRGPSRWDVGNVWIRQYKLGGEAVDLSDGTVIWTWDRAVVGDPIGLWGDVLVFSAGAGLYGINAQDGMELWNTDLEGRHRWLGASAGIGVLLNPYGMHGVDIASGKRIWKVEKDLMSWRAPLFALTDIGLLFFNEKESTVDLIDPATGEVRWMQEVSGIVRSIIDAGDLVLIVSACLPCDLNAYEKTR